MGSKTISDLFCEVVILQILEFWGKNMMENYENVSKLLTGLYRNCTKLEGCGCLLTEGAELDIQWLQMGQSFH